MVLIAEKGNKQKTYDHCDFGTKEKTGTAKKLMWDLEKKKLNISNLQLILKRIQNRNGLLRQIIFTLKKKNANYFELAIWKH